MGLQKPRLVLDSGSAQTSALDQRNCKVAFCEKACGLGLFLVLEECESNVFLCLSQYAGLNAQNKTIWKMMAEFLSFLSFFFPQGSCWWIPGYLLQCKDAV